LKAGSLWCPYNPAQGMPKKMKNPERDHGKFKTFGVGAQGKVENAKEWRKKEQKE